jgi:hypothetical protein
MVSNDNTFEKFISFANFLSIRMPVNFNQSDQQAYESNFDINISKPTFLIIMPKYFPFVFLLPLFLQAKPTSEQGIWRDGLIMAAKAEALPPNLVVRNLGILCLGMFETINAKDFHYQSYWKKPDLPPPDYQVSSALRACALTLATTLHPSRKSSFSKIAHAHSLTSGNMPDTASYEFGRSIANRILKDRMGDGVATKTTYVATTEIGLWRRTPQLFLPPQQPHWMNVRPFCINLESFLPPPPPDLNSKAYREAVEEVKLWGKQDSPLRTQEQTLIAKFWKDFGYSSTPPGHWNEIAQTISYQKNLTPIKEARLFALLNLAMADAGITAWKAKFKYHLWRPIDAIRYANQVPSTDKLWDRSWKPLLESPPHPEYISGHACYSGVASTILSEYFAKEKIRFVAKSDSIPDEHRIFSNFTACAEEIANSRLWGGIHFSFSNKKGLICGKNIAQFVISQYLIPTPSP